MDIAGKVFIVTGGASGLGRASAEALAAAGVKVAIFDISDEAGEAIAKDIGGVYCHVDIMDEASVLAGFEKARAAKFDMIIADLNMPRMNGLEMIRTLRSEESRPEYRAQGRTRLIVCSGSPVPAQDVAQAATDYDRFLTKPVRLELLLQALQQG